MHSSYRGTRLWSCMSAFTQKALSSCAGGGGWRLQYFIKDNHSLPVMSINTAYRSNGQYSMSSRPDVSFKERLRVRQRHCVMGRTHNSGNAGTGLSQLSLLSNLSRLKTRQVHYNVCRHCHTSVSRHRQKVLPVRPGQFLMTARDSHSARPVLYSTYSGLEIREKPPWRILFFGTDFLSVSVLKTLEENWQRSESPCVEQLDVCTIPQECLVRTYAQKKGLLIHDWPPDAEHRYDVGVLMSFGHLIPEHIINMFPYGIINIHPSLLPRWRGASPIRHTVLNGDEETGISMMEIRPRHFDIGPLLMQRRLMVPPKCTSLLLARMMEPVMAEMLLHCLRNLPLLERYEHEQGKRGITYAHKFSPRNAFLDWEDQTCLDIDRQYRAIGDLLTLRSVFNGVRVKLLDMVDQEIVDNLDCRKLKRVRMSGSNMAKANPGTCLYHPGGQCLLVKCKDGWVGFKKIVLKKRLTAKEFFNGYLLKHGTGTFVSVENNLNQFVDQQTVPRKSVQ